MTERKHFKRVVRSRAKQTGESYSSALRNVRNARSRGPAATSGTGLARGDHPVAITRNIPDIRSDHVDKAVRFYSDYLGFSVRRDGGHVTGFVSATHPE